MKFKYGKNQELTIDMKDYVKEMLDEFPTKFTKNDTAVNPGSTGLFDEGNTRKLDEKQADLFHSIVAKALFLSKRARLDIQPVVAVLCTRVSNPTTSDWIKLERLMKYLNGTKEMVLTISAKDGVQNIIWYVDASFAVHPDFKSHTGAVMQFKGGKGSIECLSRKQKLNTKSSTDAELVAVDDALVLIALTKLFIESQGYEVKENILYQDNKSAILLEKNGRKSAGNRSRALNVCFFYVTDHIEQGNLAV